MSVAMCSECDSVSVSDSFVFYCRWCCH